MDNKEPRFTVVYVNKEEGCLHEVILNNLEKLKIEEEVSKIFLAKNSPILVDETKYIVQEVKTNE